MQYMGSKRRVAKYILPIILKDRQPDQWYVEPFVGGGNSISLVEGKRIGADCNEHVIKALKLIRDFPLSLPRNSQELPEELYKSLKDNEGFEWHGYVGFACSYGGKYYGGYPRSFKADKITPRDHIAESYVNAQKQSPNLQGVLLLHKAYNELILTERCVIYCDPPYQGTTGYKNRFDHTQFWNWVREKVNEGHKVFISEYNAPEDFVCVWQGKQRTTTAVGLTKPAVEKLFVHRSQYESIK